MGTNERLLGNSIDIALVALGSNVAFDGSGPAENLEKALDLIEKEELKSGLAADFSARRLILRALVPIS